MRKMIRRVFQIIVAILLAVLVFYISLWVSACWLEEKAVGLTETGK